MADLLWMWAWTTKVGRPAGSDREPHVIAVCDECEPVLTTEGWRHGAADLEGQLPATPLDPFGLGCVRCRGDLQGVRVQRLKVDGGAR